MKCGRISADTSPMSNVGTGEELAGKTLYRKSLTQTIHVFSFREQMWTGDLSPPSASMGRAHSPAAR